MKTISQDQKRRPNISVNREAFLDFANRYVADLTIKQTGLKSATADGNKKLDEAYECLQRADEEIRAERFVSAALELLDARNKIFESAPTDEVNGGALQIYIRRFCALIQSAEYPPPTKNKNMEKITERTIVMANAYAKKACNIHRVLKKKAKNELLIIVVKNHAYTFREDARRIEAAPQIGLIVGELGEDRRILATGFAREMMDTYLPKMSASGFKVAICDMDKRQIRHI